MGKRMYYILKVLLEASEDALTREMIVERLKEYGVVINVKTVSSSVQDINEFFYEFINADFIKCIKKKGMFINEELFEDGQLQFILDSIMYHEDLNCEDKTKLTDKLLRFASRKQMDRLSIGDIQSNIDHSILVSLSTIIKAIENEKMIRFQYIHYSVDKSKIREVVSDKDALYLVSPYRIVIRNNHYYLIGYDDKYKNQLRTYRIDRMRTVQKTRHKIIEIREKYNMEDIINKTMNMYVSEESGDLELECNESVLREIVSKFGLNHTASKLYDDRYKIVIHDVLLSEGLIGWIFMLQDKIKVLAPLDLKEEIAARVEKMKQLYQ